jgi:hypothetical protein
VISKYGNKTTCKRLVYLPENLKRLSIDLANQWPTMAILTTKAAKGKKGTIGSYGTGTQTRLRSKNTA